VYVISEVLFGGDCFPLTAAGSDREVPTPSLLRWEHAVVGKSAAPLTKIVAMSFRMV
jgi:hypothetical protein